MSIEITSTETRFFNQVKRQPALIEILQRHHFAAPKPYERIINRRDRLKFEKSDWALPPKNGRIDTVCLYFESTRRGDFRLRVDLDPHRVSADIAQDAERQRERAEELEVKSALLREIRENLLQNEELKGRLHITARSLRETDRPYALTAVKFDLGLSPNSSPEECAQAFAEVIEIVTPLVNSILKKQGRGKREE